MIRDPPLLRRAANNIYNTHITSSPPDTMMKLIKKLAVPLTLLLTLSTQQHLALAKDGNNNKVAQTTPQAAQHVHHKQATPEEGGRKQLKVEHLTHALSKAAATPHDIDATEHKLDSAALTETSHKKRRKVSTAAITDEHRNTNKNKRRERILQGKASGSSGSSGSSGGSSASRSRRSRNSSSSNRSNNRRRSRGRNRRKKNNDDDRYDDDLGYGGDKHFWVMGGNQWGQGQWGQGQWGDNSWGKSSSKDAWGYQYESWSTDSKDSLGKDSPSWDEWGWGKSSSKDADSSGYVFEMWGKPNWGSSSSSKDTWASSSTKNSWSGGSKDDGWNKSSSSSSSSKDSGSWKSSSKDSSKSSSSSSKDGPSWGDWEWKAQGHWEWDQPEWNQAPKPAPKWGNVGGWPTTPPPTTAKPTASPTLNPTLSPSLSPSLSPTLSPTLNPTASPTTTPPI